VLAYTCHYSLASYHYHADYIEGTFSIRISLITDFLTFPLTNIFSQYWWLISSFLQILLSSRHFRSSSFLTLRPLLRCWYYIFFISHTSWHYFLRHVHCAFCLFSSYIDTVSISLLPFQRCFVIFFVFLFILIYIDIDFFASLSFIDIASFISEYSYCYCEDIDIIFAIIVSPISIITEIDYIAFSRISRLFFSSGRFTQGLHRIRWMPPSPRWSSSTTPLALRHCWCIAFRRCYA